MTDDLVKRLLSVSIYDPHEAEVLSEEAAYRIEKLEANIKLQLEWYLSNKRVLADRIEKLEKALREIAALGYWDGDSAMNIARKALEDK